MLTTALETLGQPCLQPLTGSYPPLACLAALVGALLTHCVQVVINQGLSSLVTIEQRESGRDGDHFQPISPAPRTHDHHQQHEHTSPSQDCDGDESEPLLLSPSVVLVVGQSAIQDDLCSHSQEHSELVLDGGHDHSHGVREY